MATHSAVEQERHRCEVRWCIQKGMTWFEGYIKGVAEKRGKEAAQRLWTDVRDQWAKGNRGKPGEWAEGN
jgi:hypothetical protein